MIVFAVIGWVGLVIFVGVSLRLAQEKARLEQNNTVAFQKLALAGQRQDELQALADRRLVELDTKMQDALVASEKDKLTFLLDIERARLKRTLKV